MDIQHIINIHLTQKMRNFWWPINIILRVQGKHTGIAALFFRKFEVCRK